MPYIIVRGNLASYDNRYPWRVLVSGLKGELCITLYASPTMPLNEFQFGNPIVFFQRLILSSLAVLPLEAIVTIAL